MCLLARPNCLVVLISLIGVGPSSTQQRRPVCLAIATSFPVFCDGNTIVGHGFRHMASTLLNELGFNPDAIERQLAHKGQGVRAIYNLAKHMPERKEMMQAWADYLDACKAMGIEARLDSKAA